MGQPTDEGFYRSPLYRLLDARFGPYFRTRQGLFDIMAFSKALEPALSHEAIYKWLRSQKVSPDGAKRCVALSEKLCRTHREGAPLKQEDLFPYVMA